MLVLNIPEVELYDEENNEFYFLKPTTVTLEHSLVSISKWESKWHKPFLNTKDKTNEETIDYIRCMTINGYINPLLYKSSTIFNYIVGEVNKYIEDPMTATTFSNKGAKSREIITSEIIYYWMTALNIPFECQKWHLNRLLTLINVCSIKNQPSKKMKAKDILSRNAALNAARRKKLNTTG